MLQCGRLLADLLHYLTGVVDVTVRTTTRRPTSAAWQRWNTRGTYSGRRPPSSAPPALQMSREETATLILQEAETIILQEAKTLI